jgi:amino acid transporter
MRSSLAPANQRDERSRRGLKSGALGVVSATVIGVASTAPAYSLAATVGLTAAVVGLFSPAIVLVAFIPMLFAASAYYFLNRVDPDCGATFAWVTRAMGPHAGWMGGWGVIVADVIVMPSLAWVAAAYTYSLFGLDALASNTWAIMALGCAYILAMTVICWIGIELSARTQFVLLAAEIVILIGFSVFALVNVFLNHPAGSVTPSWSWMNPFELTASQLSQGVLLAIGLVLVATSPWRERRIAYGLAVAWTVLMALSRTVVDRHWLSDVVAGSLLGAACAVGAAAATQLLRDRRQPGRRHDAEARGTRSTPQD